MCIRDRLHIEMKQKANNTLFFLLILSSICLGRTPCSIDFFPKKINNEKEPFGQNQIHFSSCSDKVSNLPLELIKSKKSLKAGVYFTFAEVRAGQPNTSYKALLEPIFIKLGKYRLKALRKDRKQLKTALGISDGHNFYLNARSYSNESYFIKAKLIGRYFYFEDIMYSRFTQTTSEISRAMNFEKKEGIVIDIKTGKIRILTEEIFLAMLATYPDLLTMYEDSRANLLAKRTILRKMNEKLAQKS